MASPQTSNGFVKIATELVEQFCNCKHRLSGEEWLILWAIIRKTYGWGKAEDDISLSQFMSLTGLKKPSIIRARRKLLTKQLIVIYQKVNGDVTYSIQKNYERWSFTKQSTFTKRSTIVGKKVNKSFTKQLPTIDTIKDNKDTTFSSFANDVVMRWNEFCKSYPVMSKVIELTPERRKLLKKRYERPSFRDFPKIIDALKQQSFCRGTGDRNWKVTFDWLIKNNNNYVKVIEFGFMKEGGESVSPGLRKYVERANDAKKGSYS